MVSIDTSNIVNGQEIDAQDFLVPFGQLEIAVTDLETDVNSLNGDVTDLQNDVNGLINGSEVFTGIDVNGGAIDGTTIGAANPASGTFTTLAATNGSGIQQLAAANLTGTIDEARIGPFTSIDINGGAIDGTTIGAANPASGTFSYVYVPVTGAYAEGLLIEKEGAEGNVTIRVRGTGNPAAPKLAFNRSYQGAAGDEYIKNQNQVGNVVYRAYDETVGVYRDVVGQLVRATEDHTAIAAGAEMIFSCTANGSTNSKFRLALSAENLRPWANNALDLGSTDRSYKNIFGAGYIGLKAASQPTNESGMAKIWGQTISGTTEIRAGDSGGNNVTLTSHVGGDARMAPHHATSNFVIRENTVTDAGEGYENQIDVVGMAEDLAALTNKQYLFTRSLGRDQYRNRAESRWQGRRRDFNGKLQAYFNQEEYLQ